MNRTTYPMLPDGVLYGGKVFFQRSRHRCRGYDILDGPAINLQIGLDPEDAIGLGIVSVVVGEFVSNEKA